MSIMRLDLNETQYQDISSIDVPAWFKERMKCGIEVIDNTFGGQEEPGFIRSSVVAMHGDPGTGKTTLLLQLLNSFAIRKYKAAYIATEEHIWQMKQTCDRILVKNGHLRNTSVLENILTDIKKYDVVMIDSISGVSSKKTNKTGIPLQDYCITKICSAAKAHKTTVFINVHNTKNKKMKGSTMLAHAVDTVCELTVSEETKGMREKDVELNVYKNRFGPTLNTDLFQGNRGYDFNTVVAPKEKPTAKPVTKKKIDVQEEELRGVVKSLLRKTFNVDHAVKCKSIGNKPRANYVFSKLQQAKVIEKVVTPGTGNKFTYRFIK